MNTWYFDMFDLIHSSSETHAINKGSMEYTFTWLIENYSYCLQKNTEVLESPRFVVNGVESTAWRIQLYPRGCSNGHQGYISIFLKRSKLAVCPINIPLKFKLSLLSADGLAVVISKELSHEFKNGDCYGEVGFIHMRDLLSRHKDCLLPQDILGVRCKMWMGNQDVHKVGQGFARTRIGVERLNFIQVVEGFSELKRKEKTFMFQYAREKGTMKARLQISDSSSSDGTITLKITPPSAKKILSTYKLILVGTSGILTKCLEGDNRADPTRKDILKLPLSLTEKEILDRKEEYLQDDKLTLLCQCSFSTGVKYDKIEKNDCDIPSAVLNEINNAMLTEKLSACSSVIDDLKTLYTSQLMTDVELKTKTKSYQAHKNVLSARSSVFKAIFTEDMKEKNTDCIQLDDFENDTVEKLLHFLYSDSIENLERDSAVQLYNIADEFAIKKLKFICSSFLLEKDLASHAAELQRLADTHNDSSLQKSLQELIQRTTWKKLVALTND